MKLTTLTAILLFTAAPAYAGSGHEHGHSHGGDNHAHHDAKIMNEAEMIAAASDALPQLVEQGHKIDGKALDASWSDVTSSGKVHSKGNGYTIVSFEGENDQTLYVLLSDTGELYDANFTGEFEGLNN